MHSSNGLSQRKSTVYDSTFDEFTDHGLFNKVKGKPNIALIGFTADGDVGGPCTFMEVTHCLDWVMKRPKRCVSRFQRDFKDSMMTQ